MKVSNIFKKNSTAQRRQKFLATAGLTCIGLAALLTNDDGSQNHTIELVMQETSEIAASSAQKALSDTATQVSDAEPISTQIQNDKHVNNNSYSDDLAQTSREFDGLDAIDNSPVLMKHVSEKTAAGNYSVTKIVEVDFKYPLIRVVEHFSDNGVSSPRLVQRSYMVADHLSVKLQDGVDFDVLTALAQSQGYQIRKQYQHSSYALVSFALENTDSLEKAQAFLAEHTNDIAYAEADYLRTLTAVVPNDPSFYRQNHLDYVRVPGNNGQDDNIGAWQAWERRTDALKDNGEYVLIGIIDTGIAIEHEDLINNIWENPNEIPDNGVDDDGNGFIDDVYGWNFFTDSNGGTAGGHGTHVAGIAAAEGNNGIGISGVAWRAKLVSANIFGSGITTGADAAEATRYFVDLGVDVMNASYGAREFMQVECDAIQEAHDAGILFVTSAGNALRNLDLSGNDQYPAECDVDNIIVVGSGSTRLHDLEDGFSNYGANAVDIVAPPWAYSTYNWDPDEPEGSYEYLEGTSMSTPMVTGAAALLMAEHPELSHVEIKALMMDTATRATPLEGTSQTGMLNVARAMNYDVSTSPANVVSIFASADDGNVPENTMDGNPDTRWSALGYGQTITFELSDANVLSAVDIQWLKGDQRSAKFSIESSLDGTEWQVVYGGVYRDEVLEQSSGSSADMEHYPVLNAEARYVRISGYGNTSNDWNSIIEAVIQVYDESAQVVLNAPTSLLASEQNTTVELSWNDLSEGESAYQVRRRASGGSWSTVANLAANSESYYDTDVIAGSTYEYRVRALDGGTNGPLSNSAIITLDEGTTAGRLTVTGAVASSDDGNIAENTLDGTTDTRWSSLGHGQWIDYSLGGVKTISSVDIAWYKGDQRYAFFTLSVQLNNGDWVEVYNGTSSGTTLDLETIVIDPVQADTLRYTGFGNSSNNWNSVTELEISGY